MSYDIFYRHQFISLPDGTYVPYMEVGSNNLYTVYYDRRGRQKEKRERSWWAQKHPFKKAAMTPQEMQTALDDYIHERILDIASRDWEPEKDPAKIRKQWGYYTALSIGGASTRRTTAASYINFFTQGVAHAKPVEYFGTVRVGISPVWYEDMKKAEKEVLPDIYCKTGEELIAAINTFQEAYGLAYWDIKVIDEYRVEQAIRNRPKRQRLPKAKKEVDKFYVVYIPGYGWSMGGRRYHHNPLCAKKVKTPSEAAKIAARISWLKPEVQLINEKAMI